MKTSVASRSSNLPVAATGAYTYPPASDLLSAGGFPITTLNAEGLATRIDETVSGAASLFGYTPDDRPYTDTLGAGTSVAVGETRLHDANDRLTQLSWSNAPLVGPPVAETYAYSYTPQGRTSIYVIASGGNGVSGGSTSSVAYSPDAHGRLLQETPSDAGVAGSLYHYDGNDNLSEVDQSINLHTIQTPVITYVYSPTTAPGPWLPNEVVSVTHNGDYPLGNPGTTSYAYDNAGNAVSIAYPDGTGDALSYDAAARLVAIQRSDGTGLSIGYNARGLRASYTITRTGQTAPLFAETFTYRGGQVGQVVVTGTALTAPLTQTYLYRPDGAPLELLQRLGSGPIQRYWYVVDGKGDVRKVIDGATGAVVCVYAYDSWGKPLFGPQQEEIGGLHQPLRYRGYWYDGWGTDTTGTWDSGPWRWYALPARPYDPDLKRFLQPDPSSQDGVRSYVYCHDAPLDCADPSGLVSQATTPGGEGGNPSGATPNLPDLSIQQAEQVASVLEGPPSASVASAVSADAMASEGDAATTEVSAGNADVARQPRTAQEARDTPGVAFGGNNLPAVEAGQQWLANKAEYAGRIPGQIAAQMRGVRFTSFSKFRQAFWNAIGEDPELAGQFAPGNRGNMAKGKAPKAPSPFQYVSDEGHTTVEYTLHHYTPIIDDFSGVYNLDNIVIVNPLQHNRIHYGE